MYSKIIGSTLIFSIFLIFLTFLSSTLTAEVQIQNSVLLVQLEGSITSMSAELVSEALTYAEERNQIVVLTISTPGGSLDSTFKIIASMDQKH